MLTKTPTAETQDTVDGHNLLIRVRRLTPRQRASWARDLVTGKRQIKRLTRRQASTICKVCLPLVNDAVNGKPSQPHRRLEPQAILAWWESASFAERVALIHALGPGPTWDTLSAVVGD